MGGCNCPKPVRRTWLLARTWWPHLGNGAWALSTPVLTQGLQGGLQSKIDLVLLLSLRKEWGQRQHVPYGAESGVVGLQGPDVGRSPASTGAAPALGAPGSPRRSPRARPGAAPKPMLGLSSL